jgi:hypothetical protein
MVEITFMKSLMKNKQLLASVIIFFYIVFGYLVIFYFLDPKTFLTDLSKQWWIILFALLVSITRYVFARKEISKAKRIEHEE